MRLSCGRGRGGGRRDGAGGAHGLVEPGGGAPAGDFVDTGVHGAEKSDKTRPRASLHLHGGNTGGDSVAVRGAYPPPPVTPFLRGPRRPPPAHEAGWKDTVLAMPGEVTRIAVPFGQPPGVPPVASRLVWPTDGERVSHYVWHCHILEHEDNDMMQPYRIE